MDTDSMASEAQHLPVQCELQALGADVLTWSDLESKDQLRRLALIILPPCPQQNINNKNLQKSQKVTETSELQSMRGIEVT